MKRKFTLTIELENAAFDGNAHLELSHLLMVLAEKINIDGLVTAGTETDYGVANGIWDCNGNWCGHWYAILDERLPEDPRRWENLTPDEMEALRTAVHCRLYELGKGARKLDRQLKAEQRQLCHLSRQLNLEVGRREGE